MLPIAVEVLTVTEQNPRQYVSMLNEEFFLANGIKDPNSYLKSMLILGREKILREIATEDRARTVEITPHRSFKDTVFSAGFHLDEDSQLLLLTYFGNRTPPETSYIVALGHVLEVLLELEASLDSMTEPATGGNVDRIIPLDTNLPGEII